MQNIRTINLLSSADHLSPVSGAVGRVIALAPPPLFPLEKKPTALTWQCRSSEPQSRGIRSRSF